MPCSRQAFSSLTMSLFTGARAHEPYASALKNKVVELGKRRHVALGVRLRIWKALGPDGAEVGERQYTHQPPKHREINMKAQSLEPSAQEMRQMLAARRRVIAYLKSRPEIASSPASHVPVAPMSMLPAAGQPLTPCWTTFDDVLTPGNTAGPGYLGYVPGGGLFQSALTDFITKCVNRHAGHESMAPGLVRLEWNVVRWLCDVLKMPDTAGGVLTTGGSVSNLMAIVAARVDRLPENFLSGVIYVSDQCHHSVRRAARTAGFPSAQIRRLPTDSRFRISLPHLAQAVRADREAGLQPFMFVGSAGTTNTGAVDDLNGLADFASDEGLWLHVDGAYGGFFMLTAQGQRVLAGIERADSVALDPHKGLGLPYGTGSLVVRDRALLRRAFGDQEQAGYRRRCRTTRSTSAT
jgi:aromatic-L-amino-acid decarboxylase